METRKSIDDCSGEEWDAATRSHWEHHLKEREIYQKDPENYLANKYNGVYEEDPVYSKQDEIFSGSIFDKACESWLNDDEDEIPNQEETYKMIEEEERFEEIIRILGPYYCISYCHGAALNILMNTDIAHDSRKIEEAKVHLSRMARLINETEGVNW